MMGCPPQLVFAAVAAYLGVTVDPRIPLPEIRYESRTPLVEFQDAMEKQWGSRPPAFTNAYVGASNEIFLIDDRSYYEKVKRTPEDSLAHEFTHYLQVKYMRANLHHKADSLEIDSWEMHAIGVQQWFSGRLKAGAVAGCSDLRFRLLRDVEKYSHRR